MLATHEPGVLAPAISIARRGLAAINGGRRSGCPASIGSALYQAILLAYDSSAHAEHAFRRAVDLARLSRAHLHILGIVETSGGIALAQALGVLNVQQLARESIERVVGGAARGLVAEGMRVTSHIEEGDAEAQIFRYAGRLCPDLVVVGDGSRGLITGWLKGSLGARLQECLSCGVLVVEGDRCHLSLPAGVQIPPFMIQSLSD